LDLKELTFGFVDEAARIGTPQGLLDEVLQIGRAFEIEGVFITGVPEPGADLDAYILLRGWSEACDRRLEPHEAKVMNEAREFGLEFGMCVPVYGAHGEKGCVSFSTGRREFSMRERAALHMIAIHAHRAMERLRPRTPRPRLTAREIECLRWASLGKTSWETGLILNIQKKTVDEYLESAAFKMNCANRSHAVAQAVRYGLIA
jgi:LuxR family quorum sensing-dependent transcriptional regulator